MTSLLSGSILTHSLNLGGNYYRPGDAITLLQPNTFTGSIAATVSVDSVSNSYAITAVNQPGGSFTINGDQTANFAANDFIIVYRSTGNDATYQIVSAVFGAGVTVITVVEAVPSSVADGFLGNAIANVGAIVTYTLTEDGNGYYVPQPVDQFSTSGTTGTGFRLLVESIVPLSDVTARIYIEYRILDLT